MRIAITHDKGNVFQHFGQTKEFKVYEVEGGSVTDGKILSSGTYSHGGLADLLKQNNVNVLICGGIGEGAKNMLEQCGIKVFPGISGSADIVITQMAKGQLDQIQKSTCSEHDHDHDHNHECHCGEHSS